MKRIELDYSKLCADEPTKGHNRWHPGIPPAVEAAPGEEVILETRHAFDGQVSPTSVPGDLLNANLNVVHPLTGPVYVQGAEPGDLLEVDIMEIEPARWAFTTIIPGFGFLRDLYLEPYICHWNLQDGYAESPQLPGVRVPGAPFMGVIGVAPSHQMRAQIQQREAELASRGGMALGPDPTDAVPATEPLASEGLRTVPPREHGGNLDIKQLTAGTRLLLPVFTEGALFSAGDAHFAQGDSECCGTAIEMDSTLHVSFQVRKGEAARRNIGFPVFERDDYFISPEMAAPRRFLAATGMCIADGVNQSEDATLAARQALLNMINLLMERGWSREQAYCICSVAVDLKLSEIVDVPNFVVSAFLPLDIFVG
ncbi:MAG: acetamidase/formamidase family protein [Dehalococcoidia bacterium]